MKITMTSFVILVFSYVLVVGANNDYENKLTKLWSLSSSSRSDGARTAVVNVTSASILIEPTSYNVNDASEKSDRKPKMSAQYHPAEYKRYAFKPRAIPLKRNEEQLERSVHYENSNQYKSDILLPGNYFPIAAVNRANLSEETTFNPLAYGPFHPKPIPLMRSQEFQRRSLDEDEEPIIEKPNGFVEAAAQRRSWPASLFDEDEEDDEDPEIDDVELEEEDDDLLSRGKGHKKKKGSKLKPKKYAKYMLPLLLAYKLKFFSLIPVMIGGLVLLVGATGLAGFFFALFAAVMGLQKGSY